MKASNHVTSFFCHIFVSATVFSAIGFSVTSFSAAGFSVKIIPTENPAYTIAAIMIRLKGMTIKMKT